MAARLGKYELRHKLGAGAMGEVWEALDTVLDRPVALKLLFAEGADAADTVREAAAAARVHHPNAVAVYDAAEFEGRWFIAMELVAGPNAAKLVTDRGRLPWAEATRIARDAAAGLSAVHAAGFVHRDVKPGNVLIAPDGTAKVADFGLAKRTALSGLTTVTGVVGTPHYMCPEQCWGELADARADVYSLGATYFTLLTGQPPYDGDSEMAVMYAHCNHPVPDPRAVVNDVPEACAAVVGRAMAKLPAARFASAEEMRAALDAVLNDSTPVIPPVAKTLRLPPKTIIRDPLRRPIVTRRIALTAGLGALAAGALTSFACWPRGVVTPPTTPALTPPPDGEPDWSGPWDFSGGKMGRIIPAVQQIAISPDGRTVAVSVTLQDESGEKEATGHLHLVTRDGKPLPGWPKSVGAVEGVAFTPDGREVAAAIRPNGLLRVFTVADGKPVPVAKAVLPSVSVVQFSDDGEWMAAAGFTHDGAVVRFWQRDANRGWVSRHDDCTAPEYSIWGFRFAPGRTVVALAAGVGPVDNKQAAVRLFEATTGREVKHFSLERKDSGPTVAFAANVPLMAVSSFGEVRLFRVPDWEAVGDTLPVTPDGVKRDLQVLAVSPDGKWVAGGWNVDLHLWRSERGVAVRHNGNWAMGEDDRHSRKVNTLAFTPDGKRLLSGGEDGKVIIHDHADLFRRLHEGEP